MRNATVHPAMRGIVNAIAPSQEPTMVFVSCCERCVEEDDAVRIAVLGGEGEVNTLCRECADARGLL